MKNIEVMMMIGGVVAFLTTLFMVRRREMREQHATVWIIAAFGFLGLGLAWRPIMWLAIRAHVMPSAIVLMLALGVAYLFCFAVTVSLSRHYQRNLRLAQELALLEQRLRDLETKLADRHVPPQP